MTSVPSADEAIATFTEQPTPLAFLSVVQALRDAPDAKKRLTFLWEAHRAQVTPLTAHDVAEVLSWLSEISPCGTFEMPRSKPAHPQPECQHVFQVGSERDQAADAPPDSDCYL